MGPTILPTFRGYTVDCRLSEFRKIPRYGLPEWIPFRSEKGDELLVKWLKTPEGKRSLAEGKIRI